MYRYRRKPGAGWLGLAVAALVTAAGGGRGVAGAEGPVRREVREASLREVASSLKESGAAPIQIAPQIADTRVYYSGRGRPLARALASLLALDLIEPAAGSGRTATLTAGKDRGQLSDRLRRQAIARGEANLRTRLNLLRDLLAGRSDARERMQREFPEGLAWPNRPEGRLAQVLGLLAPEEIRSLVESGVWMSAKLNATQGRLTAEIRRLYPPDVLAVFDREGRRVEAHAETMYDREKADTRLVLALFGLPENRGVRGTVADFNPPAGPAGVSREPLSTPAPNLRLLDIALQAHRPPGRGPERRDDPRLKRRLSLAAYGLGTATVLRFHEVLERLLSSGLQVASDSYTAHRARAIPAELLSREDALEGHLDRIAAAFRVNWRLDGDYLLFRHSRWYFAEQAEPPTRTVAIVRQAVTERGGLSGGQLADLAAGLTQEQFRNLGVLFPDLADVVMRYHTLRLFRGIERRGQLEPAAATGLPFDRLSAEQQSEFLAFTRNHRPHRLLGPAQSRAQWQVKVAPVAADAGGWRVRFSWGMNDFITVRVPTFQTVDPRRPPGETRERPLLWEISH